MAVIVYAAVFVLLMNKAHYPCEKERKKEKKAEELIITKLLIHSVH